MVLVGTFFLAQKQPPEVFYKKAGLENFAKFTGKYLSKSLFLIKLQISACNFTKKETLSQVFSCEFCEISKNTFFTEHLRTTAAFCLIFSTCPLCSEAVLCLSNSFPTVFRVKHCVNFKNMQSSFWELIYLLFQGIAVNHHYQLKMINVWVEKGVQS